MNKTDQNGFSLVELLVAMVLGLIVLGGTFSIFSGTMESTKLNQSHGWLPGLCGIWGWQVNHFC